MIQLPPLPFAKDGLSPDIFSETLEYQYGKHHQAYVNNLKSIIPGTKDGYLPLDDIVRFSGGKCLQPRRRVRGGHLQGGELQLRPQEHEKWVAAERCSWQYHQGPEGD